MKNTVRPGRAFGVCLLPVLLPVLVAASVTASAQTSNSSGTNRTGRATTITVINPGGDVIRTTDGGKSWTRLDPDEVESAISGFRTELANAQAEATVLTTVSPNPAGGVMTVTYTLAEPGKVRLTLRDERGAAVLTRTEDRAQTGVQSSTLDASEVANGVYYLDVTVNGHTTGGGKLVVAH